MSQLSATIRFGSPNACNLCHTDKSPEWADKKVRRWHTDDYQAETLKLAAWIHPLRRGDWTQLPAVLAYLQSPDQDELFANSMIRLLRPCPDTAKVPVFVEILKNDPSPLCRSSAAEALTGFLIDADVIDAVADAAGDPFRLVRMRAAGTLSNVASEQIAAAKRAQVQKATDEYLAAMMARPDDAAGHFNLGNYYVNQGDVPRAIDYFETAARLRPDFTPTYLNVSMAYNRIGRNDKALTALDTALGYEPAAAPAHLNRALLLAEMGRMDASEQVFQAALRHDPRLAVAAYNLAVLTASKDPKEALQWSRKAAELAPGDLKYAYTAAYYAQAFGYTREAVDRLRKLVDANAAYPEAYALLADIYQRQNQPDEAVAVYQKAAQNTQFPPALRDQFRRQIDRLRRRP